MLIQQLKWIWNRALVLDCHHFCLPAFAFPSLCQSWGKACWPPSSGFPNPTSRHRLDRFGRGRMRDQPTWERERWNFLPDSWPPEIAGSFVNRNHCGLPCWESLRPIKHEGVAVKWSVWKKLRYKETQEQEHLCYQSYCILGTFHRRIHTGLGYAPSECGHTWNNSTKSEEKVLEIVTGPCPSVSVRAWSQRHETAHEGGHHCI